MKLAPIFNHHMVFAANKPIVIWGQGKGDITVRFAEFEQTVKAQNGIFASCQDIFLLCAVWTGGRPFRPHYYR